MHNRSKINWNTFNNFNINSNLTILWHENNARSLQVILTQRIFITLDLLIGLLQYIKEIIGWKLSTNNDVKLIIDSFDSIKNKTKNVIVHSDHGACYTSSVFTEMLKKYHWTQSMSRVGNALDNRVVEFWFSILKTELIYNLNTKKISFKELENKIVNFINYYNNVKIQEKLNWMILIEYKNHLQLNI